MDAAASSEQNAAKAQQQKPLIKKLISYFSRNLEMM
jgi:hypothetical protein